MSRWTHVICSRCWQLNRGGLKPPRLKGRSLLQLCCFCTALTDEGILVRGDPTGLSCAGRHDED